MLPAWIQEVEQVVQQSFWGVGEAEARARISGKRSLNCILNCLLDENLLFLAFGVAGVVVESIGEILQERIETYIPPPHHQNFQHDVNNLILVEKDKNALSKPIICGFAHLLQHAQLIALLIRRHLVESFHQEPQHSITLRRWCEISILHPIGLILTSHCGSNPGPSLENQCTDLPSRPETTNPPIRAGI
jgi:hypothetical protein